MELELYTVVSPMWVLGIEPWSSGREDIAINHYHFITCSSIHELVALSTWKLDEHFLISLSLAREQTKNFNSVSVYVGMY